MKKSLYLVSLLFIAGCYYGQLGSGLVSQYYFNGNANDMVGNNHGIVRGATLAMDRFGSPNSAYCFNGQNNLINLGTSSSLKSGTMSISFWAKITGTIVNSSAYSNHPFIFTKASNLSGAYEAYFVGVYKFTDMIDAATSDAFGFQTVSFSNVVASQDVWRHIVYSFTTDSTYLYVDNQLTNQLYKGYSSVYLPSDSVVLGFVGNIPNGGTYSWLNGCLDDFRIYNRKLNRQEIAQLYQETRPTGNFSFPGSICIRETKTFTDNSMNSPTTWAWSVSPATGVTINSASSQNPSFTFANAGTYLVTLTAGNALGSGAPITKTVTVSACTGIEQLASGILGLSIYPNPSNGKINFNQALPLNATVHIYNQLGEKVKTWLIDSSQQSELDGSFLPKGVYLLQLISENITRTMKLITN
jgi:PKD repeat protein